MDFETIARNNHRNGMNCAKQFHVGKKATRELVKKVYEE